jgi:hypothetical protein
MVENPTDEDWAGVKMALISGRPISFKMDLYNPLYVDRPTVEPELFASLRPVTYRGRFKGENKQNAVNNKELKMGGGSFPSRDAAPQVGSAMGGAIAEPKRQIQIPRPYDLQKQRKGIWL